MSEGLTPDENLFLNGLYSRVASGIGKSLDNAYNDGDDTVGIFWELVLKMTDQFPGFNWTRAITEFYKGPT